MLTKTNYKIRDKKLVNKNYLSNTQPSAVPMLLPDDDEEDDQRHIQVMMMMMMRRRRRKTTNATYR